jgi:hypothetical protein
MLQKQVLVAAGMTLAVVVIAVLWLVRTELPLPVPLEDDTASRLAFVARWMLIPGFALFAGIVLVANRRFFLEDAIDGTRAPQSRSLEINLRYNQNTLEQTVLAGIAWSGLALALPRDQLTVIPALAILFGIGRAVFWIGYLMSPGARALGFALTFYPTVAALIWLAIRATA